MSFRMHRLIALASVLLAHCAAPPPLPLAVLENGASLTEDLILLGEQHDAPLHQQWHAQTIAALAARGQLAAVALEMAEHGASTAGLRQDASDAQVQAALRWNESAWPWSVYRDAIMAAVSAGIPVLGANLPRTGMRAAMADEALDRLLPAPALQAQQQAIRAGHCNLLPESQVGPMARIQIARDRRMALTLTETATKGKSVVLIAGGGHVDPDLGVPQHLPADTRVRAVVFPRQPTQTDYCALLKRQLAPATTR